MRTKAAVLRNIGGPLMIEDLETPALTPGQVLIKVLATGLCQGQLNEIAGRKGKEFIPHLIGHEASGTVVEISSGVTKVAVGDYVVASWIKGSGMEMPQVIYKSPEGPVNAGALATFTEYAVVSENRLAKLPKEIEPTVAALFGCAVPTGMGIVDQLGDVRGKKLIILGIGGIGAAALLRAISKGANCLAVDVVDWKLDWAKNELGAPVINFKEAKKQGLKDFDFAIECSGNKEAMDLAFSAVNDKGLVVIAGNLAPGEKITIDPFDLIKGKRIKGSWGGDQALDQALSIYVPAYLSGQLPLAKLISKTYSFSEINQALIDLRNGKMIRGCLTTQPFNFITKKLDNSLFTAQKVLITGGAGYVGSALVPSLLEKGYEVIVYDLYLYGDVFKHLKTHPRLKEIKGDIRDAERLINAGRGVDQLIHLACISNDPTFDLNPALGKSINYDAFFNVIATIERNQIKRLIYASSSSVYGVREGEIRETVEPRPITDYSRYKYECEKLLHHSPINHVILRPATICGYAPRKRLDVVVNTLTINGLVNKKISIFGGSQKRPNLNIKDMVAVYEMILAAPDSLVSGEVFNIGQKNLTVKEIAHLAKKVLGDKEVELEYVDTQDIRSYHLNTNRMVNILKFTPHYSVEEAITSLKKAYDQGLFIDALNNPLYHNIKLMRQINLI